MIRLDKRAKSYLNEGIKENDDIQTALYGKKGIHKNFNGNGA